MAKSYSSFTIGRIFGIPIKLHITFLLVLPFFAYLFGTFCFEGSEHLWLWKLLLALGLFAGVTLHESAHSYVAMKNGIKIESITLLPIGGVSQMEDIPEDPRIELRIAIAGPLMSILIGALFLIAYVPFMKLEGDWIKFLLFMGAINLVLGIFNLLPAFPMDGGRILRTFLARRMKYDVATHYAVIVGHIFAIIMLFLGILYFPGGIMLIIIAMFLYIGGSEEERQTGILFALKNLKVKDFMTREVDCLREDLKIIEAMEEFLRTKHILYPVVGYNNRFAGILTLSELSSVSKEEREALLIKDVIKQVDCLTPNDSSKTAVKKIGKSGINRLPVVENEKVVGIVSIGDIVRTAQIIKVK